MRISQDDYLMGREQIYPDECTAEILENVATTVEKVNSLLAVLEAEGIPLEESPTSKSIVSSGWRPPQINAQVKNAAPRSKHMTGEACDLYDPEGLIDDWCLDHLGSLSAIGLWLESPSATKGWAHVQTVPPRSGKRVFIP